MDIYALHIIRTYNKQDNKQTLARHCVRVALLTILYIDMCVHAYMGAQCAFDQYKLI